jgi:hypothetical protein
MFKLTSERITWTLGAFLAGVALGGTGLRATPASKQSAVRTASSPAAPFFFYDLENELHHGRDPRGKLRLVAVPLRFGEAGLLVRIEVWNPSIEAKLVHPIYPGRYQLSFRDAAGTPVEAYTLPPGTLRVLEESELALVDYGNCLSADYVVATFYNRIRQRDLECRVKIDTLYFLDPKGDRRADFQLSSDWVKVPPP